ncbi:glycine cleavage system protein R [Stutzerimonas tarimensis]|uniref:Glycine cleavage system transcriptional repressor n=1 Tax=Stutzerimonas tarimensis TaxID=1507735 RepID=A0ABV7T9V3_9GAMM
MDHLVVTVIAEDQPGLVERIAKCITEHGGNWLDSRMAHMAGQFAGILRIGVMPDRQPGLIDGLKELEQQGIRVLLAGAGPSTPAQAQAILLELVGNDRPGIIREITRLLAEHRVNLESLDTDVLPAPMSGEPLFHARARLAVPSEVSLGELQTHLETLADDLMVELQLQPSEYRGAP